LYWLTIVLISSPLQTTPCRQRALPGKTDTTKTAVGLHLVPGLVELEALTHCWMSTHHNRVARQWLHRASWRRISLSMVSWLAPPSLGHDRGRVPARVAGTGRGRLCSPRYGLRRIWSGSGGCLLRQAIPKPLSCNLGGQVLSPTAAAYVSY
jgi:hypothetical protein